MSMKPGQRMRKKTEMTEMTENDSPEREIHRTPLKLPANGSELGVTA